MEHPFLRLIAAKAFIPLGWFEPLPADHVPEFAPDRACRFVLLIGNAGPSMFFRFTRERTSEKESLDAWTRRDLEPLAEDFGGRAVFPFDRPHLPFLTWTARSGAGFTSPLGMSIHPVYGLWYALRAAILLPVVPDLPRRSAGDHPCGTCAGKPCLTACPATAFSEGRYDVARCAGHLRTPDGAACMDNGCMARHACPVGQNYRHSTVQAGFHMRAFLAAH